MLVGRGMYTLQTFEFIKERENALHARRYGKSRGSLMSRLITIPGKIAYWCINCESVVNNGNLCACGGTTLHPLTAWLDRATQTEHPENLPQTEVQSGVK